MFRTVNLVKTFEHGASRIEALRGVSIDIPDGEIYGIIGRSGAGKSTLIRCLNLLERPTSGQVILDDVDLTRLTPRQLRSHRLGIGMVFQHFHLLHSRTVLANVTFPLEIQGVGRAERRTQAMELLDLVGLADRAGDWPSRLSGGQKQRVGIARALAGAPRVLLCDEATSALDSETTDQILALLQDLNAKLGVTIVIITHEMSVVRQVCGSAALLDQGRVAESGRLTELIADPASALGAALLPFGQHQGPQPDHGAGWGESAARPRLLLTFTDTRAASPALGELTRDLGLTWVILGGGVERIAGRDVGRLTVELNQPATRVELVRAVRYLGERGMQVQILESAPPVAGDSAQGGAVAAVEVSA